MLIVGFYDILMEKLQTYVLLQYFVLENKHVAGSANYATPAWSRQYMK